MRDLEFNEDFLFKNFTRMSKTNFYTLLGIVEPNCYKTEYYCNGMRYCFRHRSTYLKHAL
jgi:hypothetical protein